MQFEIEEVEGMKEESRELLDVAEQNLMAIDQGADFAQPYDAIFRSFHNLKGAAGMMEMTTLQAHMHELESYLVGFKEKGSIPKEEIQYLLRGVDGAREILENPMAVLERAAEVSQDHPPTHTHTHTQSEFDTQSLGISIHDWIAEAEDALSRIGSALVSLQKRVALKEAMVVREEVDAVYRDIHSLKGSSYLFSIHRAGDIAHAMETELDEVRNERVSLTDELITKFLALHGTLEDCVESVKSEQATAASQTVPTAIVSRVEETASAGVPPISVGPKGKKSEVEHEASVEAHASIRVSVGLLDNLMTLMGELVLVRNQVLQHSEAQEDTHLMSVSKRLSVVTAEMQGEMMKTRLQPVGSVLSKFHRVVRDLAQSLGKKIELQLKGEDTELDKSVLEAMKDPLTHIVRNACDHGIEAPNVRASEGKTEQGRIVINAFYEGGQVVLEVTDDGKGLHRDVLIKKALTQGILDAAQAERMSDRDAYQLIFHPGFSTAAAVTNVSGRGVGMDVVKTNIDKIGGHTELSSEVGKGTCIRIKIPLTLAIVPALIVRAGGTRFAIPQIKVQELVRVKKEDIERIHQSQVYRLRGKILPLVGLTNVLGEGESGEGRQHSTIAVVHGEEQLFGLVLDDVQEAADIVVKPLNALLKALKVYSGATIMGDGSIALILDIAGIESVAEIRKESRGRSDEGSLDGGASEGSSSSNLRSLSSESQSYLLLEAEEKTRYAIPLSYVFRLENRKRSEIESSGDLQRRMIQYGDTILPLLGLNGTPSPSVLPASQAESDADLPIVVVKRGDNLFGITVARIVDTMQTTLEVDARDLGQQVGVMGHLNLSDGIVVVVDPFALLSQAYPESVKMAIPKPLHTKHKLQKQTSPYRVLLVEDSPLFRRGMENALVAAGHVVTSVTDGRQALAYLNTKSERCDFVVTDIEMPNLDGFQLVHAIRSDERWKDLPIIAVSSRFDREYREKGVEMGIDLYLEKFNAPELIEAIRSLSIDRSDQERAA